MLKIRIKYLADIEHIKPIVNGDWIDLRTAVGTYVKPFEYSRIPLGVAMELPEGYEAIVAPRSSTCEKYGVLMGNSIGVIDESYKGDNDEWHFPVIATRNAFIPKDTRICQFRIVKHQPPIEFETVDSLGNDNRGGFGSTGTN